MKFVRSTYDESDRVVSLPGLRFSSRLAPAEAEVPDSGNPRRDSPVRKGDSPGNVPLTDRGGIKNPSSKACAPVRTIKTELQEKPEPENGKIDVSQETAVTDHRPTAGRTAHLTPLPATPQTSSQRLPQARRSASQPLTQIQQTNLLLPEKATVLQFSAEKGQKTPTTIARRHAVRRQRLLWKKFRLSHAATTPSSKRKDAEDPQYEEVMSAVDNLWSELRLERNYAETFLAHAESLQSKLATTTPKVLQYPVLKNIAAAVPDRTSYELPDTQELSLLELQGIKKTLSKLL
ncbi:hypothetical protein Bbelb_074580 [Branchiostoma belcheri]|nr:hypothetical protein Bbelb_074580 [Branchiostoma belcheri]